MSTPKVLVQDSSRLTDLTSFNAWEDFGCSWILIANNDQAFCVYCDRVFHVYRNTVNQVYGQLKETLDLF